MTMKQPIICLALCFCACSPGAVFGNDWLGAGPNDLWTTPSNWSLGVVPVNSTTNPGSGWDDPTSPFYPLTPSTADDYPLGNNDVVLNVEGTRTLIDSTVNAKAYAVRVGLYGASNELEVTGGTLLIGGYGTASPFENGHFLDIGRDFNNSSNPNPLATVKVSGGTINATAVWIPEQTIDPSKADPYDTAPLNGELVMTGGTVNTYWLNLGQLVGNGRAELSGNAQLNLVMHPQLNSGGFLTFNRNWYDAAGQPIQIGRAHV